MIDFISRAFATPNVPTGAAPGSTPSTPTAPTPAPTPTPTPTPSPTPAPQPTDGSFSLLPTDSTLVERIQSGRIQLSDIPEFIAYFIQIGLILASVVAFLMILVGGYQYIIGGVYSDMREQGKQTLTYAIGGFILTLLAYAIVTIIQLAVTTLV